MSRVRAWSGVAEAYRRSFATLCSGTVDRLLADTAVGPLLDVGGGTGELAARAATGRAVLAVDADPDMVAIARTVVPGRVMQAALPALPLADGGVAATTANFVVNHVPDPRAAVRELARVTRRGGRLAMTSWTARPPGWSGLVQEAFGSAGVVPLPGERLPEHLDFERSVAGLAGLAEAAGLEVLVAEELGWTWEVAAEDLWAGIAGGVAGAGRTYVAQPAEVQEAAAAAYRRACERDHPDGVLRLPSTAAYVLATR